MGMLNFIVTLLLIVLLGLGAYVIWDNLPGEVQDFKPAKGFNASSEKVDLNGTQFYSNMRYPDKYITYSLFNDCNEKKKGDVREAFSTLSAGTILVFDEISRNAQISILCSEIAPEPKDEGHFVAGEGGPKDIFVSGYYHVITTGKISLFRDEKCDKPQIALHEILHALGFDHNNNPKSIMYPVTSCDEKLDNYIADEINRLYIIKSAPDLEIINANAQKSGKYTSFVVEIANYGFVDALSANLSIYSNDKKVKDFDLESIPFGNKKKITVDNLIVPRDTNELKFKAYLTYDEEEISSDNNEAALSIG